MNSGTDSARPRSKNNDRKSRTHPRGRISRKCIWLLQKLIKDGGGKMNENYNNGFGNCTCEREREGEGAQELPNGSINQERRVSDVGLRNF